MSEGTFGTWTVPESPVDIEYSMIVIDEIRQAVAEGFQRLSRGGIEVGGILYGTVVGRRLRIMAVREIACEHARGPTFHLSENDRALLAAQLERERDDPRLSGMVAVGWYLSHTRSEITLPQNDLDVYQHFFPEPWQVTMVIRPGRASAMRAGFFVREPDGTVKTDQSYHDFAFPDRLAGILDRPPRERAERGQRRELVERRDEERITARTEAEQNPFLEAREAAPREDAPFRQAVRRGEEAAYGGSYPSSDPGSDPSAYPSSYSGAYPGAPRKLPWVAIAVAAVAVVAVVVGMRYFGQQRAVEPLGLAVSERDGQLRIEWNPASRSIAGAARAAVEIVDGDQADGKKVIDLTQPQIASGNLTYVRKSGDVQVHMTVSGAGGTVEEASRFLGNPPAGAAGSRGAEAGAAASAAPDAGNQAAEADAAAGGDAQALQDEIKRLRGQNSQQAERIRRLERTLIILQTRLGIRDSGQ